ncbi:prolyl oligopeptidase family serine peptidase [Luteibacter sp. 329MFSha]|uniref:S9 family peptidase n=1 Tax=Luteibacter sp. 329MFSha TaxID=1798239 RepID=UPI0008AE6D64|nr:prolyl oligopeptidase family serine peptidase [Luteibacter sp. 329MFSha]SEW23395.1 Dipeptidyl aminopeptidase/acylaminoacyl peptidase [Luteibacter sp. 329MFSha]
MRVLATALLTVLAAAPALAAPPPLDMETIMADPDWIGPAVEDIYWSVDGGQVYYSQKRDGNPVRDLWRVPARGGAPERLDPAAVAQADGGKAVFDREHRRAAFIRHGDVFLRDLASGATVQVTRSSAKESDPRFSADGRLLTFRADKDWFTYAVTGGPVARAAELEEKDDPKAKKPDALADEQQSLFTTLRGLRADEAAMSADADVLAAADPNRAPKAFWLGKNTSVADTSLSPDGRWLLVVTQAKDADTGKVADLTHYVTDSGYAEPEATRPYVGRNDPAPQSLRLLDLKTHASYDLDTGKLPGIGEDPLADLRAKAIASLRKEGKADRADALAAPKTRPVIVNGEYSPGIVWSDDGQRVAVQLRAIDNKDRWIATVDFERHALVSQHRLTDKAWINWDGNDFGWLRDGRTLWYLSEESGYAHLYVRAPGGKATALTAGRFEVDHPVLSPDGTRFYVRSNKVAPYSYDIYSVPVQGGELARVTSYQGLDDFALSPDGRQLAVLHSSPYIPSQLATVGVDGASPRDLTDTRKPAFKAREWVAPTIVGVPSTHGAGTVWAKFYGPADAAAAASRPAVIFVHGAGYLQNVHLSYPAYFREQMFHNLLVQRGYVVLDMDYRASKGYGRDWRTAIYRQMGHPELDDLLDGKAWLVREHGVDPKRVGIYGGSYGGFMTLMALLRTPGEFAAGAALRPVTDWTSYNHEYTSNILNDPQIDPEAYKASSPIQYADALSDPLLIEHGLIDDNVLASDSIRLYQRFIELHKKNFWMSLYPLERHGFVHADSWYDEYRRIDELFREKLEPAATR